MRSVPRCLHCSILLMFRFKDVRACGKKEEKGVDCYSYNIYFKTFIAFYMSTYELKDTQSNSPASYFLGMRSTTIPFAVIGSRSVHNT
jgi:hypothetical protein